MSVIGDVAQLIIACTVAYNAFLSWRNGKAIETVHLATNSMKDQLIKVTGEAEFARGVKQAVGESEFARGVRQGDQKQGEEDQKPDRLKEN